jgi:hypothetical protein
VLGKYIISEKPMSEEEWARQRADVLDANTMAADVTRDAEPPRFGENHLEEANRLCRALPLRFPQIAAESQVLAAAG